MKSTNSLTTKQHDIFIYIANSLINSYYCPSVREIGKAVGLTSTASVQNYINVLEKLGYIKRIVNKNRSIQLTDLGLEYFRVHNPSPPQNDLIDSSHEYTFLEHTVKLVPLVGSVQAGLPITAIENHEDDFVLPLSLTGNSDCFLLRVKGDSMKDIGMLENDMLIVRSQATANNGDIVVARIEDEATVKRFYKEKDHIRLQPENEDFEPILTKECIIEGKVVGLIRDRF